MSQIVNDNRVAGHSGLFLHIALSVAAKLHLADRFDDFAANNIYRDDSGN